MKFQHKDILLIDDDPVSNLINKRIIENQFGCNTIIFTNAEEALNQLKTWLTDQNDLLPPVIFLDIDMPHMTGWEFLDELHKLPDEFLEKCRVIILTSSIDFEDINKSKSYKVVRDFISKPLTPARLKVLV
jgi:CheY-like chemotaxis protein